MSNKITITLTDEQLARLRQAASRMNLSPADAALVLAEEGLRQREFPGIHFRDTDTGHQACIPGSRVPVYFLAELAREVNDDIDIIAEHYSIRPSEVMTALDYIHAYPDEIEQDSIEHEKAEQRLLARLSADQLATSP